MAVIRVTHGEDIIIETPTGRRFVLWAMQATGNEDELQSVLAVRSDEWLGGYRSWRPVLAKARSNGQVVIELAPKTITQFTPVCHANDKSLRCRCETDLDGCCKTCGIHLACVPDSLTRRCGWCNRLGARDDSGDHLCPEGFR